MHTFIAPIFAEDCWTIPWNCIHHFWPLLNRKTSSAYVDFEEEKLLETNLSKGRSTYKVVRASC